MAKVLFIDLLNDFFDRHGIYSLSSFLKRNNIEVHFIRERNYKKALGKIADIKPDLLLYSSFSSTMPIYKRFDSLVKKVFRGKSLIGGTGPTFDYECINDSTIDAACIGEGELPLVDLIKGNFRCDKNIFYRKSSAPSELYPFVELDNLPFPDRDLVYGVDHLLRDMPSKHFLSGRGCPYECTYCFNHKFREIFKDCGPVIRKKSVAYLLDEIRFVQKKYPLLNVVFSDDTFILDRKWFLEFCERFTKEIGLTYTCNVRANLVDEEVVRALRESNCVGVNWSIESGNDFLRNEVLERKMTREQILNCANLLTKYKVRYRIGNLIGLPGESFGQMLETVELNIKARPFFGFASIFVPFPGLRLTQYAIENGHYKLDPETNLPLDYSTTSVMNIGAKENRAIQKLRCMFPLFVKKPALFYKTRVRRVLFRLPLILLKAVYESFYTYTMMRLYVVKAPFSHRCRMAIRYILNLWS